MEGMRGKSSLYGNAGVSNKIFLMEYLVTAQVREEDKAHLHVEKLRSVVDKLGNIDASTSSEQHLIGLLSSLPKP